MFKVECGIKTIIYISQLLLLALTISPLSPLHLHGHEKAQLNTAKG
jgi:hypothetical protein